MNYLIILFGARSIFYVKICTCVSYITFFLSDCIRKLMEIHVEKNTLLGD